MIRWVLLLLLSGLLPMLLPGQSTIVPSNSAGNAKVMVKTFTSATSVTVTAAESGATGMDQVAMLVDDSGYWITPYSILINTTTYDLTADFNGVEVSGTIAVIVGAGTTAAAWSVAMGSTLVGATAGRLLYVGAGPVIAESSAWNLSGSTLTGSGHLLFSADNTYDIGASGATRPRTLYIGTNVNAGGYLVGNSVFGTSYFSDGNGNTRMYLSTDGIARFTNGAVTDFSRLQLGGTTASFPAIKRNGTAINLRLADDSADAPITASTVTASSTMSAAPGGTVGAWAKYTVEDGDSIFLAANTTVTKTLVALPANVAIEGIRIKTSEAYAGTGITACTVSLGDGTTADVYASTYNLVAAVAATNQAWDGGATSATAASHNLVATFTCNTNVGDGGATVLTAGAVDIHVKWAVLP